MSTTSTSSVLCGLVFASLAIGWTAAGRLDAQDATPPQNPPVFRGGVNLLEMDVSVLDRNRRPVKGLTAADFTVLDDGQPKKVVAFSSIDVPDAEAPSATWMRTAIGDVTSNQLADRRLVVILISDRILDPAKLTCDGPGLAAAEMMQKLAHTVVHDLGPADLASVEYVYHRALGQPFTMDQAKLDEAVDRFEPIVVDCGSDATIDALIASGLPARDMVGALNRTISALGAVPDRRKLVFVIDDGNDLDSGPSGRDQLYRAAQRANVTLNSLDPDGLVAPDTNNPRRPGSVDPHAAARETVVEMAHNTGGEAVVNTNDPASEVPEIFRENQSYYLVAFEADPGAKAGLSRHVEVKVNRPDVEVLARHGYYTSGPGASTSSDAPAATAATPFAGPLPAVSFPLEVAVAPFAGVARPIPSAEIALHVTEPGVAWSRNEVWQVEARAYSADGDEEQRQSHTVRWAPQSGKTGDREGTTILRMDLSPGYHELRIAVRSAALGTTASVFADVDVPDFAREPASLSGVVVAVGATGAAGAAPNPLAGLPTTSRVFATSDRVTASLSIYQGARGPLAPVTMTTRARNEHDEAVFSQSEIVAANRFVTSNRRADWAVDLPLSRLTAGSYVLTIEAVAGAQRAQRDVTFSVR